VRGATRKRGNGQEHEQDRQMESGAERCIEGKDGTPIHVRVVRASSPKGCVIVVHGLADHAERYRWLTQFLQDSGYNVVLYDQRGHGRSGGARTHVSSFDEYVDDLERVREALQSTCGETPHLFAHSMGTLIALLAVVRRPEHWRSVIVQGFPALPGRSIPPGAGQLIRALRPLVGRMRAPTGLSPADLSNDEAIADAYLRDPLTTKNFTLSWVAAFLAAIREVRENAIAVTCPLLILHGGQDRIALPEGSQWLERHAGAKDRQLVIFPGLKHELHNETAPERVEVFARIGAWLDQHPGQPADRMP
jgi:lysophospholipase